MRICLVLSLLAALLLAGCGGEEMTPVGSGGGDTKETTAPDEGQPAQPDRPKRAKMSPDATLVKTEYTMVKNISDYETQKKTAAEKAKQHQFTAPDAQIYVGYLFKLAEDPAGAAQAFKKFADGCPDSVNHAAALYEAGMAFKESNDIESAESCLDKLIATHADKTKMIQALGHKVGEGYALVGNVDKAAKYLKEASDGGNWYASLQLVQLNWIKGDFDAARAAAAKLTAATSGTKEADRAKVYSDLAQRAGTPAKEFDVEGWTDNVDFTPSELKGKVYVVYCWKMPVWANAVQTTKLMAKMYDEFSPKGLMIVGLNKHYGLDPTDRNAGSGRDLTMEQELDAINVWAKQAEFGVRWPLGLVGNDADHDFYGWWGDSIPSIAVVDKQGRLRYVQHGLDDVFLRACITQCLKE